MCQSPTLPSTGSKNLITDVPGILVGNADDVILKSGVTVLTAESPFVASVDVMGGAPGTRETDCLLPHNLVDKIDALVLSGGSVFGLDAASGVTDLLRERDHGYPVGDVRVPIVPAAILFDLLNGGDKNWQQNPYNNLGREALKTADSTFRLGSVGAGTGATTSNLKGGLGSASMVLENGVTVAALVAANPRGSVAMSDSGAFWSGAFELKSEFGGMGVVTSNQAYLEASNTDTAKANPRSNTTIAIVATDAVLTKSETKRLAVAAQDGIARATVPSHTLFDGDLIFALSTEAIKLNDPLHEQAEIGHAASICLSRAIARGVYEASPQHGDILPCWKSLFGQV